MVHVLVQAWAHIFSLMTAFITSVSSPSMPQLVAFPDLRTNPAMGFVATLVLQDVKQAFDVAIH